VGQCIIIICSDPMTHVTRPKLLTHDHCRIETATSMTCPGWWWWWWRRRRQW